MSNHLWRHQQNLVAADVSRRKHLKLAQTNVRGYRVMEAPLKTP
jgi:hypothetical protein